MKIHLHGYLHDLYPHTLDVQASSVAEAISSLQLVPALNTGSRHSVQIPGFSSRDALYDTTEVTEIHVHPVMAGAGGAKPGVPQIIIGIALIIIGAMMGPGGSPMISQGALYLTGSMMILGGVLQLLAPQPKTPNLGTEEHSRYLGNPRNTVAIGTRIPLVYGRRKVYGHYLSFDIDAKDLLPAPSNYIYKNPFGTNLP